MLISTSSLALLACGLLLAASPSHSQPADRVPPPTAADQQWRLPPPPVHKENPATPAKVELGMTLFFDPRLSSAGALSCAACHEPSLGWADGRKTSIIGSVVQRRASPTIVNLAYNPLFMWDGRRKSLEEHARGPFSTLTAADYKTTAARFAAIPGYQTLFAAAYPGEPIEVETIAKALAVFQRSVISNDSPFDNWLAGDTRALTPQQFRGYKVFTDSGKGNCAACHNGPNFTDNGFHNVGVRSSDPGRFDVLKIAAMKGAFKTPTLREIEMTAPYFHNGAAATLRDVVDHYDRGGDDRSNLSPDVRPLKLSGQEKDDLVAFMRALTGKQTGIVRPVLPQ